MVPYYYTRQQEKLEIALIDMFNNIVVAKYNDNSRTVPVKTIKVPITITGNRNFADYLRNNQTALETTPIPIMALRFKGMTQNSDNRTQTTYIRSIFSKATDKWIQDIQPTPYLWNYELEVLTDNRSDFGQLIEQIAPYFNTFRTLRIKEFDFAPDIERKIPVYLESVTPQFEDEKEVGSSHTFIRIVYNFQCQMDLYRPFSIEDIIKYTQMNIHVQDFLHSLQVYAYPTEIANKERKEWEQVVASIREGYSLLKTNAQTLIKKDVDKDGNVEWVNVTADEARRPAEVPSFKLLHLNFDDDTPLEDDQSGFGRDFVALNDKDRTYIPDLPPGAGQHTPGGYASASDWNNILNWFGTNDGLCESNYTFSVILQFTKSNTKNTVFQMLKNKQTKDSKGKVIPAGEVYFEWGLSDAKLYFRFKTYGGKAQYYTFTAREAFNYSNTDIYKFVFVLYNEGKAGIFGYSVNGGALIALECDRT